MNPPSTSLIQNLRALPRPVWILLAGTFLNKFGAFVIPFLAIYLRKRGFTDADAGTALAAYGAGHFGASLIGGYLADRIGRRKTIALSMFGSAAAMLLLSQANTLLEIAALSAITGLAAELYRPASGALLTDLVPPNERVIAFAAYRWALNGGFAFGSATAGFLAKYSFTWLFIGDALTSVAFGLLAWFALPHGVRATKEAAAWSEAWRLMKHDRRFHTLAMAQLAISLIFFQVFSTFGIHVTSLGFPPTTYGMLISLNGVLIVAVELWLTAYTRRFSPARVIALGYVLVGIGFSSNIFAHTLPGLGFVIVLFTAGEMLSMPVAAAYVTENVPPEMRGRYLGAYGLVGAIGLMLGPAIGLRLHAWHPNWLWAACGALGILGAVLVLNTRRSAQPELAVAQQAVTTPQ